MGRFINADTPEVLTVSPMSFADKNLFAYCDNNPVTREDDGGCLWNTVIGAATGAFLGAVTAVCDGTSIKAGIVFLTKTLSSCLL